MKLGMVGLGKMGFNMAAQMLNKKIDLAVYDPNGQVVKDLTSKGAKGASTIASLIKLLGSERAVWLMVPSGAVDSVLDQLAPLLKKGDIIIDGGNSNFNESVKRAKALSEKGISFIDIGVSGGTAAAKIGYCMMAGGDPVAFKKIEPFIKAMCVPNGYGYFGPNGAGHFVKMVHNAIEYGMMESLGEGYELLSEGPYKGLDLEKVSYVWSNGSIIRGFLMDMTKNAFNRHPGLKDVPGSIADTGEGKWAVEEAMKHNVPFTVNTHALYSRYRSRKTNTLSNKLVAALRDEFGGHGLGKK